MFPSVEIRHLLAVIALAEELNFRRAADRLHITQPALSKQITDLEAEHRFHLFTRNKRRIVELTDAGRVFVQEARSALSHTERAVCKNRADLFLTSLANYDKRYKVRGKAVDGWAIGREAIRQLWRVAPPFVAAVFSREGMLAREGRVLIRGKFRRLLICSVPALARHLGAHYGLQGGCNNCGASCNLLFRCPYWDTDSRLCTVYESRPLVCRTFPITPTDLRDRDLLIRHTVCGFHFAAEKRTPALCSLVRKSKEQSS